MDPYVPGNREIMLQVNHVLCLMTGAPTSSAAFRHGVYLTRTADASLYVGQVPPESGTENALDTGTEDIVQTNAEVAVRVRPPVSGSDPAGLRSYVEEIQADMVIVDTPSDRDPVPALAAKLPRLCIENLDVPVFVTGHQADVETLDTILVPSNFSEDALVTLNHAIALAEIYDASIKILHVIDTDPFIALTPMDRLSLHSKSLPEHRARRHLGVMLDRSAETDVEITSYIVYGDPATQIIRHVSETQTDLLVLSGPSSPPDAEPVLGDITDRVLRRITTPVFFLPTGSSSLLPETTSSSAIGSSDER